MNIKTILFSIASVVGSWVTITEPAKAVKFGFSSEAKIEEFRFYNVITPKILKSDLPQGEEIYFINRPGLTGAGDSVSISGVKYNITDENGIGTTANLGAYNGTMYLQNASKPAGYCVGASIAITADTLNPTSLPLNTDSTNSGRTGPYYSKYYSLFCSLITLNIGDNGLPKPIPDVFTLFANPSTQALTAENGKTIFTIRDQFSIPNAADIDSSKVAFAPTKFSEKEEQEIDIKHLGFGESLTPDTGVLRYDPSYTFPFDPFADCSTPGVTCVTRDEFETVPEPSNSLASLVAFSVIATILYIRKRLYLEKKPKMTEIE
jgi:hypothetical protein